MTSDKKFKISFPLIAAVLLWLKTYVVYKTSFSITIENTMQEFILFLNPLPFLLIVLGLSFFMKKEKSRIRYVLITAFVTSFILYANVAYYRFFNDFLTLPVLFQTSNFADLTGSAAQEINLADILYFADFILLAVLAKWKPSFLYWNGFRFINRPVFYLVAAALLFTNVGLAETERPQLLTRTFDRELLVKNIGTYNYHLYDIYLQTKTSAQRALADGSELAEFENAIDSNYREPNKDWFGKAEGRNVIMISLESLQSFVINNEMNGHEVTPFLNSIIDDSLYFENFYHQTSQGKTSDSEFILDNSLFPTDRGAVFFTHSGNTYNSLTKELNGMNYFTNTMHANNKSFWNRDIMYDAFGYDCFYELNDYEVNEENSVGWGMKDDPFFKQSVEHMKEMPKPFASKLITLTNHHPFVLDEEDKYIPEYDSNSGTLNRYFQTVRYMDEAVKNMFQYLKDAGLYEDSIIVMYGDHYGISENHNAAMKQYLGKDVDPYVSTQLQRVPMYIHIPGVTDEGKGKTFDHVGGQVDLRPTILHLLGKDTQGDIQFGSDLLAENREDLVVLRDGRFITDEHVYAGNACYDRETGEEVDAESCETTKPRADEKLMYSDKIIYGDLLRFYGEEGVINNEELNEQFQTK
ncbi:LTA synthase family protein [Mangrovibacillus cuniculi]|uniref:LTA synthase family protein n=1 Tax=Mangrovibacillus cuniculi TaxID=2593652 RepID=A0A7S8CBE0_9BACI|nr:LTA synthase family protein [Mangrovibacillus cuniculi]QPC46870.1 LTA synthase family protein [Mangrovibacillus cuniculi]